MNGAFHIGATGLRAQQAGLDALANNIANLNTPAFKRSRVSFGEMVSAPVKLEDAALGRGSQVPAGVVAETGGRVFAQGELRPTGDPQHLAIEGRGFLELLGPNGQSLLWRGGALKVNREGYLSAQNGLMLRAAIQVPPDAESLVIDRDGRVFALFQEGARIDEIGRIDLAVVRDLDTLEVAGEGLYRAPDALDMVIATPGEEGSGFLVQGALEGSNVRLSDEMVALMLTQRAFAANAQVLQTADELMSIANNLKR